MTARLALALSVISLGCSERLQPTLSGAEVARAQSPVVGEDGAFTAMNDVIVNRYSRLVANALPGDMTLRVASVAELASPLFGPLAQDDLLLVVQMQGATIQTTNTREFGNVSSLNGAGLFEFVEVEAVDAATNAITIKSACSGLKNGYSVSGKTQVIRVPQFTSLSVPFGSTIKAPEWDGSTGGVVALHVRDTLTLAGTIDVNGLGFRGGSPDALSSPVATDVQDYRATTGDKGGEKGEGIGGDAALYDTLSGRYGRGAPANGGGGGNSHRAGGGGGANATNGNTWSGQGVMDGTTIGAAAWALDPGRTLATSTANLATNSGGGRGGYSFSTNNLNATATPPGNSGWGGNGRSERGGLGGRGLSPDPRSRLFLGGGGGAGDGAAPGGGGRGGGLVFVMADQVTGAGGFTANGADGQDAQGNQRDGAGGGGAGGTVVIRANALSGFTVSANGGSGGRQVLATGVDEAAGPGGGGSGGFIATTGGTVTREVAGGRNGETTSNGLTEFPANGATRGAAGALVTTIASVSGSIVNDVTACLAPADLRVTLTNNVTASVPGSQTTYTLTVRNEGPGGATRARLQNTLPAQLTSALWSCAGSGGAMCPAASGSGSIDQLITLPASATLTFTVQATIIASATGTLVNTATVFSPPTINDPILTNNVATDSDALEPEADLGITLTTPNNPVDEDSSIKWIINTSNAGRSFALNPSVTFTVPPGVTLGAITGSGWSCTTSLPMVTCSRASLGLGAAPTIEVNAVVQLAGGSLTATATVSSSAVDLQSLNNTATLTTTVDAVNDAPVNLVPPPQTMAEDTQLRFWAGDLNSISFQDVDLGNSPIEITLSVGGNGVLTLGSTAGLSFSVGDGTEDPIVTFQASATQARLALSNFVFKPNANFSGAASLQFIANDLGATGKGGPKATTSVVPINVTEVNDPPTAVNDQDSLPEDTANRQIAVLANDLSTPDQGEVLTVTSVTKPAHGDALSIGSAVIYTPQSNYFGPDSFQYTISDGNGGTATASVSVTVTPVNDPVIAVDDTYSLALGDTNALIRVMDNDITAPDVGETLTVVSVTQPSNGAVTIDPNGVRYSPNPGYMGGDSFTYRVTDGNGSSATATVTTSMAPANLPPVVIAPAAVTLAEDTLVVFSADAGREISVSDPDAADAGVLLTVQATNGTFSLNSVQALTFTAGDGTDDATLVATGSLTALRTALADLRYAPAPNFNGPTTLLVRLNDLGNSGGGGPRTAEQTVTLTVTSVNDAPTAGADTFTVLQDDPGRSLNVLANDSFLPDSNEVLTVASVTTPMHGTATVAQGGASVTYRPARGYFGPDSFQYTISDGNGGAATASVTIDVTDVNDPPSPVNDLVSVPQDSEDNVIDVLVNDSSAPDLMETLTLFAVSPGMNGVARIDAMTQRVLYTPQPGYVGPETLTYVISDNKGGFAAAIILITVGADTDRDGLSDLDENVFMTDPTKFDTDGDGLGDGLEVRISKTNPRDDDSDDDGILDGNEDADKDGAVDPGETKPLVADTDLDGLCDGLEAGLAAPQGMNTRGGVCGFDADPASRTNPTQLDSDSGGDPDNVEDANGNGRVDPGETDPNVASDDRLDRDKDGLSDQQELLAGLDPDDADTDDDGVLDGADGVADSDGDGVINARDPDSDDDGILDGTERGLTSASLTPATDLARGRFVADADPSTVTNPTLKDTDGDALEDGREDADHDGALGPGETDASRPDTDDDGLSDGLEVTGVVGTDPRSADTDGDGLLDGQEDSNGNGKVDDDETNPTLADTDRGGATDGRELAAGSNPLRPSDDWVARGGGGCSSGPGDALPWLVLGAALFAVGRRRRRAGALAVALAIAGTAAQAQTINTTADVQRFKPGTGSQDFLNLEAASVAPHLSLYAGLFVGYANAPLVLQMVGATGTKDQRRIVNDLTWFDLSAGIALADHFELGVALPMSIARGQPASDIDPTLGESISGFGVGDLRLAPKYSFFARDSAFQLAVSMPLSFPTGNGERFRGGGPVTASPRIAAEVALSTMRLVANVGALVRTRPVQILNVSLGQEVTWGVGAVVPVLSDRLAVMLALNGAMPMGPFTAATVSVEGMAGLRFRVGDWLALELAGGAGLSRGIGAPIGQVVFGASYQSQPIALETRARAPARQPEPIVPMPLEVERPVVVARPVEPEPTPAPPRVAFIDSDRDGVADEQDRCPGKPETINGISDDDGCPDTGLGVVSLSNGRLSLMKSVSFAPNGANLTDEAVRIVDQLALVLKANPAVRIRIDVFVTEAKTRGDNEALSGKRARAILQELVKRGVDPRRILAQGKGMERPIDPSSVEISTQ
jgi:uncharacterized repeat protein (TIGR01451 family)